MVILRSGMTAVEVAARSGVDSTTLSKWINGRQEPKISNLEPVLKACDSSLAELEDLKLEAEGTRGVLRELEEFRDRVEKVEADMRDFHLAKERAALRRSPQGAGH